MLQDASLDAVVICTPDHWHVNPVLDAAAAGKDIYCEKPLTLTLAEGKLMMDAVRKHRRVFQTGSQQRTEYDHRFATACELVRGGRIGKVLTVHVGVADPPVRCDLPEESTEPGLEWDRWLGPAPARPYHSELSPRGLHNHYPRWRRYSEYSGGYLADMGAHHFDIAQWGLGRDTSGPVRVEPPKDEKALRGATLIYDDGVRLVHGGPSGTTFIGTDGVIAVDRGRLHSVPESILKDGLPESAARLPRHKDHIQNWVDCMRSRERCICDVEVGARSAAVCHLANLAYRERRVLTWDPTGWTFRGESGPSKLMDNTRRDAYALPCV
jgi:predicted dehydrogenase